MENYEYTRPPVNRNNNAKLKRLKRKNRSKSIWIAILVFIIVFLIGAFLIAYAKYYKKTYKDPSFEYISMTEEASARAYVWLSKIEDTNLTYEDVKSCMGSFNLEVVKTPTDVKGQYEYKIADGSYEYCLKQAELGLESAYLLAIKNRIIATEYSGEVTDELVGRLMEETFGMNVSEYLKKHEIKLLPEEKDINVKAILEYDKDAGMEVTDEN